MVASIDGTHDSFGGGEVAGLGPMRKLEAHEDSQRLREIAQPREPRGRALTVRIGKLGDDMPRLELGGRIEDRHEALRVERGVHAKELHVVHLHSRVREPRLGLLHQRAVVREVVQRLPGRHPREAKAHIAIAGARHVDCGGEHSTAREAE
jgi:hypothetical protein